MTGLRLSYRVETHRLSAPFRISGRVFEDSDVVVVELDDGGRMISNVVGYPNERLEIGLPVEVTFEKLSDEVSLPKFRVVGSQTGDG